MERFVRPEMVTIREVSSNSSAADEAEQKFIDVSEQELYEFPLNALSAHSDSVRILNAFGNRFKSIPLLALLSLSSLHELHLDHNELMSLPAEINTLANLQSLSLHDNRLQELPDSLFTLTMLRTLRLDRNQLRQLPDSLGQCRNLELLHVDGNPLISLPESIGELEYLRDLGIGTCSELTSLPSSLARLPLVSIWIYSPSAIQCIPDEVLYNPEPGVISSFLRNRRTPSSSD
jgi:Leucine-rich repeat (LRR) protein